MADCAALLLVARARQISHVVLPFAISPLRVFAHRDLNSLFISAFKWLPVRWRTKRLVRMLQRNERSVKPYFARHANSKALLYGGMCPAATAWSTLRLTLNLLQKDLLQLHLFLVLDIFY